jgi:drug/metabolite transporter (DMT)-like permease
MLHDHVKIFQINLILLPLGKLRLPVHFFVVTAMLIWGMSFIWSTVLLKYYEPVTIIFVRLLISTLFLFGILWFSGRMERLERKDYKLVCLSALFNPFLYFLGENFGLKYSTPTISAVIIATIPVFSPVIGFLGFREKLTYINLAGILISFGGVLLMLVTPGLPSETDYRGILFLSGAVIAALLYSVTLRKLTLRYNAITLIAHQNLIGIFLFLPFFLVYEAHSTLRIPVNPEIVISMLLLAILASSVSFVFYAHTVKLLGISKTNIFSNLIPVFTAIFSFFLLKECFTFQKIAGMILVIGGVYLTEWTRKHV